MTEKLLTGTLSLNTNKQTNKKYVKRRSFENIIYQADLCISMDNMDSLSSFQAKNKQ